MSETTTTIGGQEFGLVKYEHDDGFDLLLALAKVVMPSIYDVIRENPSIEAIAAAFENAGGFRGLLQTVHLLPARIHAEGGSALIARFFVGVFALETDAKSKTIRRRLSDSKVRNEVFGLRFGQTFRVLAWVLQENFGPFFAELGGLLEELSPKPEPDATERLTSDAEA